MRETFHLLQTFLALTPEQFGFLLSTLGLGVVALALYVVLVLVKALVAKGGD